ncbi:hypothetical protein R1sor_004664 [Riccia sorocarpa]|uniref:FCP1 homology domain-containing protein n=1 Tax=Riccia sorocarpa TaxID=122646 RepID=A0ABD3HHW5_9MARC
MVAAGKKLLVLDVNGLLLDTYFQAEQRPERPHDAKVNRFYVYQRNGCEDFVQFCLENFVVGVWSSAREYNVQSLVEFMFKESMGKLAFIWHQEHCTDTKLKHPENKHKPVFLKELSKLWDKCDPALPWEKGDFGPSNTVLIDDSPYKALRNPPNTGIFPQSYKATAPGDNYLADELRKYLEGLVRATDVQVYISQNPFGVPGLAHGDEHFEFFSSALVNEETPVTNESLPAPSKQEEKVVAVVNASSGDIVVALPDSDTFAASHRRRGKTKFGSTVEESLEYRSTTHIQSPRDFAERLTRTAEASKDVTRERYSSGDADPAVPEDALRRQPWSERKSSSRGTSHERDSDRHHNRRGDGLRNGADARHSPHSRKRIPAATADRHWGGEAGYESHHSSKRRNPVNGSQWVDKQAQYPREMYAVDTTMPGRWQERAREWDPPVLNTRQHVPRATHTALLRPGLSPVSGTYRETSSRGWELGRAKNPVEDHIKIGWAGEGRSPGRHRNHEGQLRDRLADRGRPKDRDSVHVEALRDPYLPVRSGPRVDEDFDRARIRGHQSMGRAGVRDQEDVDRSARPSFSRGDGDTRGGSTEFGHDWSFEKSRGRSKHQGEVDHGYSRHSHVYDSRAGAGSSNLYGEYDNIKRGSKVPRRYDERSEDRSERDRPRTWGGVGSLDSGRTELHVRRENPIGAAIRGRMSSWEYEQAHSRPRTWNKWER